jgi:hypothetical protein
VLSYTFWHTGALLANYIEPGVLGYVAALGIELAVVTMSIMFTTITRGKNSPSTKVIFWFVFISALSVSALANIAEGFKTYTGLTLTLETVKEVDGLVALVGVSATGLLSLIVMSLSELLGTSFGVVSDWVSSTSKVTPKGDGKSKAAPDSKVTLKDDTESGVEPGSKVTPKSDSKVGVSPTSKRGDVKRKNIAALRVILQSEPVPTKTEIAERLQVSRATVNNYIAEIYANSNGTGPGRGEAGNG